MSKFIPSYPKILQLGSQRTENIFEGVVDIEEKIDGSQFRFGINEDGELVIGSHRKRIGNKPDKMFNKGIEYVKSLNLTDVSPDTYFYTEYLNKPKHNTLRYERTPKNGLMLFGVLYRDVWENRDQAELWADFLKIDVSPLLYSGNIDKKNIMKALDGWLQLESYLGGETMEGVVIKNFGQEVNLGGKIFPLFCKYTSEKFKEKHQKGTPKLRWSIEEYAKQFCTEARWMKAIYRLRDEGKLKNEPSDIGKLIKEILADVREEELENIREELEKKVFGRMIGIVISGSIIGFADFYKEYLLKNLKEE